MFHKREPVGNTCPMIDGILRRINLAIDSIKAAEVDNSEISNKSEISDALWELDAAKDEFEKVRSANSDLRHWGQEEASEVDDLNMKILEYEEIEIDIDYMILDLCGD